MSTSKLTGIRFEHFKAFEEEVAINFAPITLIAGVNSGGKSSILQTLLLARQTLLTPYRSTQEDALIYDGDLVSFADFKEMVYGKPESEDEQWLRLGFTVQIEHFLSNAQHKKQLVGLFNNISPEIINAQSNWFSTINAPMEISLGVKFGHNRNNLIITEASLKSFLCYKEEAFIQGPVINFVHTYGNFCEWVITLEIHESEQHKEDCEERFDRFIPVWEIITSWKEMDKVFEKIFTPALTALQQELTENLYYIGPLRSAPQRPYIRRNVAGLDIGSTGEYTIQQLHEHWEDDITFVALPESGDEFHADNLHPTTMKVGTAVRTALHLLGMEQEIKIERPGQSYEASLSLLSEPETYVAITDVGFGVSQILPVIALGLLTPIGALLLFEQPEIHLHPRAQAGLADFLLCLARSGKRVLVETHSDHMIDRFRRRMAEDSSNEMENAVQILFVQPPTEGSGATVETAQIDRYGMITNWPPGFLTESAKDARATMLAASNKRLQEKSDGQE